MPVAPSAAGSWARTHVERPAGAPSASRSSSMSGPSTATCYMDLKLYLEDLLGIQVDLVKADRIEPDLNEYLLAELIDAA